MRMSANDLAWMKGEGCYEEGDTIEQGAIKAEREGYLPGSQGFNAFLSAFSKLVHGNVSTETKTPLKPVKRAGLSPLAPAKPVLRNVN